MDDVFAHVDANRDAFVERLAGWVRRPSVSATGQGMPEAAGHAHDLVAPPAWRQPWSPPAAGRWSVATAPARPAPPRCSCTATTTCSRPTRWTPGPARRSSPRSATAACTGRGADKRGQHLAQLLAMESLLATRGELPCTGQGAAGRRGGDRLTQPGRLRAAQPRPARRRPGRLERRAGRPGRRLAAGVRGQGDRQLRTAGLGQPVAALRQLRGRSQPAMDAGPPAGLDAGRPGPDHRRGVRGRGGAAGRHGAGGLDRLPVDVEAVKAELGLAELDAPAGAASPSGWPPG